MMIPDYYERYMEVFGRVMAATEATRAEGLACGQQEALEELCALTEAMKANGGRIFFCGNGASAAFASHMTLDWSKNGGVPAISLNDPVQLTALGNDLGYDQVFAAALRWHGKPEDLVVVISSSGSSPNVVKAIGAAREIGMKVLTFTGLKPDNASRQLGDLNYYVPAKTYGVVECAHQLLLHAWLDASLGLEEWDRDTIQNMRADEFQA